jgi:hypothetical protein
MYEKTLLIKNLILRSLMGLLNNHCFKSQIIHLSDDLK